MLQVPAALTLVLAPHTYVLIASGKNFDVAYPRKTADTCTNDTNFDKRVSKNIGSGTAAFSGSFYTLRT